MLTKRWLCATALACATQLAAQKGTFTTFGHGCGQADNAYIVVQGPPLIGQTFYVRMQPATSLAGRNSAPRNFGSIDWLITGASRDVWNGKALPRHNLPYLGGCSLLVSMDVVHMAMTFGGGGSPSTSVFAMHVPNNPSLIGSDFYQQCVSWTVTNTSGGFRCLVTNGSHGVIGS